LITDANRTADSFLQSKYDNGSLKALVEKYGVALNDEAFRK
jgi:hypothetical protein